jgi:predicted flap endonuclease-1-like 5' DNA nuclease
MDTTTSAQHSTASIDFMGSITIVHIVLMVVLAAAAILVIWWGSVLRRRRREADHQVAHNREIAEDAGATAPPAVESPMGSDLPATAAPRAPEPTQRAAQPEPTPAEPEPAPAYTPAAAPTPVAAEPPAEPVSIVTPVSVPALSGASELTQLKGLGPKLAATLAELGYTRVDQIADLTPVEAEALDARLGAFQGRMARDRWIEQARLLTAGDRSAYEAAFGKL